VALCNFASFGKGDGGQTADFPMANQEHYLNGLCCEAG
jgi:hypothetical protein